MGIFFVNQISRFEVDLNRSLEKSVYRIPEDAWGLDMWHKEPTDAMIAESRRIHKQFYKDAKVWLEKTIKEHKKVVVIDIHAYNHVRAGNYSQPAAQADNPDIDMGVTTADSTQFGHVIESLTESLASHKAADRQIDVRHNVRYPDGGHWPEWIYKHYGADVCAITLEYKKFFMDEWTGHVYLPVLEDLKKSLRKAINKVKGELSYAKAS